MCTSSISFAPPGDKTALEAGMAFTPQFDAQGLITAIAVDDTTGNVLMLAHMNAEALAKTLSSGDVWYYSRSRQSLWRKGETSGNTQRLISLFVDCDQDALLLRITQLGPACHTGAPSCFYRKVEITREGPVLTGK